LLKEMSGSVAITLAIATECSRVCSGGRALTEELLGLGDFGVPHLKLIRSEEVHHTLPDLVAVGCELFGNIRSRDVRMIL
jgi:hypothetical protein